MSAAAGIVSRTYPTPIPAWAEGIGLVNVVGERILFGHIAQKEVIILATGVRGVIDPRALHEYEGENIVGFRPPPPKGEQFSLLPCDCEPPVTS